MAMVDNGATLTPAQDDLRRRFSNELNRLGESYTTQKADYLVRKVQPVIASMVKCCLVTQPQDVTGFLLSWLFEYRDVPPDLTKGILAWLGQEPRDVEERADIEYRPPVRESEMGEVEDLDGDDEEEDDDQCESTAKSLAKQEPQAPPPQRATALKSSMAGDRKEKSMRRVSLWQAPPPGSDHKDDDDLPEADTAPWNSRQSVVAPQDPKRRQSQSEKSRCMRQRRYTVAIKSVKLPLPAEEEILNLIRPIPAFAHLSEDNLKSLAVHFESRRFETEEDVVTYGSSMEDFHIVVKGSGRICVPQQVGAIGPGDFFGEQALRQVGSPWSHTVSAMGPITTISLKGDAWEVLGMQKTVLERTGAKKQAVAKAGPSASHGVLEDDSHATICQASGGCPIIRSAEPGNKTPEEKDMIRTAVKSNKALTEVLQLSDEQFDYLIDLMYLIRVPQFHNLTNVGETGNSYYVVNDGVFQVEIFKNGVLQNKGQMICLRGSDSFGELALLYDTPRNATVKAVRDCEVWVLTRTAFQVIMRMSYTKRIATYNALIQNLEIFSDLGEENKDMIADALEEMHFLQDENVVTQDEECQGVYIVFDGECEVIEGDVYKGKIGKGSVFGEKSIQNKSAIMHEATVSCASETATLLFFDKLTFSMVMKTIDDIKRKSRLSMSPRDSNCSLNYNDAFRQSFASRVSTKPNMNVRESVAAHNHFFDHIDKQKQMHNSLAKRVSCNHARRGSALTSSTNMTSMSRLDEDQIFHVDELETIGKLGEGSFGYVVLVKDKVNNKRYGLKAMKKAHIQSEGLMEMVANERSCQFSVSNEFVVRLHGTYQSNTHVYMVLEPCLGGELFDVYNDHGFFKSTPHCVFYTSCVVFAFEGIHAKRVIYRDLKLENCLLTASGYCKLTDMGLAKMIIGKTYTVCGTADYFAPETLKQTGHNRAVDWWALGVLMFVMMAGRSPFDAEDVMQIYKNIVKGFSKVKFPKNFPSDLTDVIKSLGRKKPEERITMQKGGTQNLKEHPFFSSLDWDQCQAQQLEPPFIPPIPSDEELAARPRNPVMDTFQLSNWDGSFDEAEEDEANQQPHE